MPFANPSSQQGKHWDDPLVLSTTLGGQEEATMSAKRLSIQPTFHLLETCYEDQVRKMARASAILTMARDRRRLTEMSSGMVERSHKAKKCLPEVQDLKTDTEKILL